MELGPESGPRSPAQSRNRTSFIFKKGLRTMKLDINTVKPGTGSPLIRP